jgi:hypothetical protein
LFLRLLAKGAYWEVDLGRDVDVKKVIIYNRNDGDPSHAEMVTQRLSNSVVSLFSQEGSTLKNYTIGDAKNIAQFEFDLSSNPSSNPSSDYPTASPHFIPPNRRTQFVRVQLNNCGYLHLREVEVFDQNGVNVAFKKAAIQSSTYDDGHPASKAVNGYLGDWSHTSLLDCGK